MISPLARPHRHRHTTAAALACLVGVVGLAACSDDGIDDGTQLDSGTDGGTQVDSGVDDPIVTIDNSLAPGSPDTAPPPNPDAGGGVGATVAP